MSASTSSAQFTCEHCSKQYKANFTLRRHVRRRHPDVALPQVRRGRKPKNMAACLCSCSVCGQQMINKAALRCHRRRYHNVVSTSRRHQKEKRTLEFSDIAGKCTKLLWLLSPKIRCYVPAVAGLKLPRNHRPNRNTYTVTLSLSLDLLAKP